MEGMGVGDKPGAGVHALLMASGSACLDPVQISFMSSHYASNILWSGLVWSGLVWFGLVWLVWLVWSGLVWFGLQVIPTTHQ